MTKLISPAPGGVFGLAYGNTTTRPYTPRRPHKGQDWMWRYADVTGSRRVVAPHGGRVVSVYGGGGNNSGWGNRVEILIPSTKHRIIAALNHLATGSIKVREGDVIGAGDHIGQMGATGEVDGVHLHEELWIDGVRVDPNYYRVHDLPGTITGSPAGGKTTTTRRKLMFVHRAPNGDTFITGPKRIKHLGTMEDVAAAEKTFGSMIRCDDREFRVALIGLGIPYSQAVKGADWAG